MKLSDFKGIMQKSLLDVIEIDNPNGDYYTVKLSKPEGFLWTPGEHGIFTIPDKKVEGRKFRAFSIASTPEEGFILIGFRVGEKISSFKKEMIGLKKGEHVKLQGPFGFFKLKENNNPLVFIAGGVGITPFRSLLLSLANAQKKVIVLYSAKEYYLFENDINIIAEKNNNIIFIKTSNRDETTEQLETIIKEAEVGTLYYVSGAMGFINSIKGTLSNCGIKKSNILNDPFLGY